MKYKVVKDPWPNRIFIYLVYRKWDWLPNWSIFWSYRKLFNSLKEAETWIAWQITYKQPKEEFYYE